MPAKSLHDLFAWNVARENAETAYRNLWLENKLDAILTPLASYTAPPIDCWSAVGLALWNLVDYPSCILPVGKVEERDVVDHAAKYGENDDKVYSIYSGPEDYEDAPTTIQLVGMKQEDERLAVMAVIVDSILNA
jgi:amidase